MAKAVSTVLSILFLVTFASVENAVRADTCSEGLGSCAVRGIDCNAKCQARHGPSAHGSCDNSIGPGLCTCFYQCGLSSIPPRRMCDGRAGPCGGKCGSDCCDQRCGSEHRGGRGFCDSLGNTPVCHCMYPC